MDSSPGATWPSHLSSLLSCAPGTPLPSPQNAQFIPQIVQSKTFNSERSKTLQNAQFIPQNTQFTAHPLLLADVEAERNRLKEETKLLRAELALSEKLRIALLCGGHGPLEVNVIHAPCQLPSQFE
jgi:hypothetical protein